MHFLHGNSSQVVHQLMQLDISININKLRVHDIYVPEKYNVFLHEYEYEWKAFDKVNAILIQML